MTFNMYYVLCGRPSSFQKGDLALHLNYWEFAKIITETSTVDGPYRDTLVVLSSNDFWRNVIKTQPTHLTKYASLKDWQRLMGSETHDVMLASIRISFSAVE